MGGSIHSIKRETEALVITSKGNGLEINSENTKYMFMLYKKVQRKYDITLLYSWSQKLNFNVKFCNTVLFQKS
jgi:hypothetical protein